MRAQSLTLAVAGLVLLAPTTGSVAARHDRGSPGAPGIRQEGAVRAADLLARVRDCVAVSRGRYRTDDGMPATVPVCGTREAVFWTADMDIDCDGRPGAHCNSGTDPLFSDATAYSQSDGRYLSAETLPYIVVPQASDRWNPRDHGVRGGAVAAVVYRDRVQYAVVGDVGPPDIIGEASYATAAALGIRPDPHGGGTPAGVTYIVFRDSRATPIESHESAVVTGERLARSFVGAVGRAAPGAAQARRLDGPAGGGPTAPEDRRPEAGPDTRTPRDDQGAEEAEDTDAPPEATEAGPDEETGEDAGEDAGEDMEEG